MSRATSFSSCRERVHTEVPLTSHCSRNATFSSIFIFTPHRTEPPCHCAIAISHQLHFFNVLYIRSESRTAVCSLQPQVGSLIRFRKSCTPLFCSAMNLKSIIVYTHRSRITYFCVKCGKQFERICTFLFNRLSIEIFSRYNLKVICFFCTYWFHFRKVFSVTFSLYNSDTHIIYSIGHTTLTCVRFAIWWNNIILFTFGFRDALLILLLLFEREYVALLKCI